jgi:hypothetical protein
MNLLSGNAVESDADEQLLFTFSFRQTVKLASITLTLPQTENCPQTIKLFKDQQSIGFSEAENDKPIESFEIGDSSVATYTLHLNQVKWSRVETLSLFIEDNHGAETSIVNSLQINGQTIQGTNVADIKGC